jgi:hypothetical protein
MVCLVVLTNTKTCLEDYLKAPFTINKVIMHCSLTKLSKKGTSLKFNH